MQRRAGSETALAHHAHRILLPKLSEQLRLFFPLLPFIVISYLDSEQRPWGTILHGTPGFVSSPEPDVLRIDSVPGSGDPFADKLRKGASIGLLGIELPTRRRNRVNGIVSASDDSGFTVTVEQAFGNCPKYIQQRRLVNRSQEMKTRVEGAIFRNLDDFEARTLLDTADTMFVASYGPSPDGGPAMDISHRGGRPGFMRLDEGGVLTIPDFAGNRFFNSLGNIVSTGRAGLVVPAFNGGDVLILSGAAIVRQDEESTAEAARMGAERLWRMRPEAGRWLRGALPIEFSLEGWSPQTVATAR